MTVRWNCSQLASRTPTLYPSANFQSSHTSHVLALPYNSSPTHLPTPDLSPSSQLRTASIQGVKFALGWHMRIRARCLTILGAREGPQAEPVAMLIGVPPPISLSFHLRVLPLKKAVQAGFELFYTASNIEALSATAAGVPALVAPRCW